MYLNHIERCWYLHIPGVVNLVFWYMTTIYVIQRMMVSSHILSGGQYVFIFASHENIDASLMGGGGRNKFKIQLLCRNIYQDDCNSHNSRYTIPIHVHYAVHRAMTGKVRVITQQGNNLLQARPSEYAKSNTHCWMGNGTTFWAITVTTHVTLVLSYARGRSSDTLFRRWQCSHWCDK